MDTAAMSRAYGEVATDLKRAYWRRYAPGFCVMDVSFEDLTRRPADTVGAVLDFLGRKPLPYLEALIERKFQEGEAGHVYATFPNDLR
jgi:hypothetical protein